MKRSRFSEEQIIGILKEHQAGMSAMDLCRKYGFSDATFYKWRRPSDLIIVAPYCSNVPGTELNHANFSTFAKTFLD